MLSPIVNRSGFRLRITLVLICLALPMIATAQQSQKIHLGENKFVSALIRNPITSYQRLIRFAPKIINILRLYSDPRDRAKIVAILLGYYEQIDYIAFRENSAAFQINGKWIYYADGKLLDKKQLPHATRYKKIFYNYDIAPLNLNRAKPVPNKEYIDIPRSSALFFALLNEQSRDSISKSVITHKVLNLEVRAHPFLHTPLKKVESSLINLRLRDRATTQFLEGTDHISGHVNRRIAGSVNLSMHTFGLALDFIPKNARGKAIYWQWIRDGKKRDPWWIVPHEERLNIPPEMVALFESHGFIWGGKWDYFDTIHFEYRPELIIYGKIVQGNLLYHFEKLPKS